MGRPQRGLDRRGGPDGPVPASPGRPGRDITLIDIVGGCNLQLHVCPVDPSHPHLELVQ
ncbi:hypothetical protein [Streptomyces thermolilacinus]|uniref:hypothetical protein n=1 Tax=Streptomyces thermolilacinus TaxID=285540 RepID=UPI0004150D1F|nr:hypothetical protein [Streptomyces thermolilacinus]